MFKLLTGTVLAGLLVVGMLAPAAAAEASQQTADTVQASITRISVTWNTFVFDDLTDSWTNISFEAGCSGFVADPDGYVVTAGHCLDPELASDSAIELRAKQMYKQNQNFFDGKEISLEQLIAYGQENWKVEGRDRGSAITPEVEVIAPSGDNSEDPVTYQAEVVDVDVTNDVALLKVDATGLPALLLADEDDIEIGESVFAVGFPGLRDSVTDPTLRPTFKSGSISDTAATREQGEVPIYETSAPMGQGMSGGPTVNAEGEVVGVNSYGTNLNNDFNWIAPSHLVDDMLDANDVDGELGQTDILFRQALDAFYSEDFRTASAKLQAVLAEIPDHPVALGLIEEARDGTQNQPLSEGPTPALPLLPVGIAMAIVATLGLSFLMGRAFARRLGHQGPGTIAMAMPAAMPAPVSRPAPVVTTKRQAPVQDAAPPVPAPAAPAPVAPAPVAPVPTPVAPAPARTDIPMSLRETQAVAPRAPIGFQPPAATEDAPRHRAFCTGCGNAAEPGANFCRKCGTSMVL